MTTNFIINTFGWTELLNEEIISSNEDETNYLYQFGYFSYVKNQKRYTVLKPFSDKFEILKIKLPPGNSSH